MRLIVALVALLAALAFPTVAQAHHRCGHKAVVCPTPTPTPEPTPTPPPDEPLETLFVDEFEGDAGVAPSPIWSRYPWAPTGTDPTTGLAHLDGQGNLELVSRNETEAVALWTRDTFTVAPPFEATAWVKFPTSWEVWHAFWWENGTSGDVGEIDFYENGGLRDRYQAATHEWHNGSDTARLVSCPLPRDPTTGFARYGARVTSMAVTFLYEGVACATLPLSATFAPAGFLILDLWPSIPWNPSGFPSVLKVARVEVRRL